jgi:hypothetical protein
MPAGKLCMEGNIGADIERWDEIEVLEHQSYGHAPILGSSAIIESGKGAAAGDDLAGVGMVKPGDQMKQRALSAPRLPRQRHALAAVEIEIDALQYFEAPFGGSVGFSDVSQREQHRARIYR